MQTVLVTAGGSGIGRAIAEKFLATGAQVLVCDISEEALQEVRQASPSIRTLLADVSVQNDVDRLFADIATTFGGLDVVVNNAGIGGGRASIDEISDEDWDRCMAVNITGAFRVARSAARLMKVARAGAVINISTGSVRTGLPFRTPYIVSKQGLMGLTQNLARELGPHNIRCNAILPGLIDNARGRSLVARAAEAAGKTVEETEAEWLKYISMRCWIDPDEVGDLAVFLASPAARHITGQFIGICGGVEWES
jgi:NAD(P)-dependent dehydrogenase (short-subunit alcohol dehydrogenase family)